MVDSFNISMSQLVPGDTAELKMKGGNRLATVKVGLKSWSSCVVTPDGKSYPDTLWGVVNIMEQQVGTSKSFNELEEFKKVPTDKDGELFTGDFVNDSSKSLEEVMPGDGKTEERYDGGAESEVAGNYTLDTLATEDGYEVDVDPEGPVVDDEGSVLDLLDNSVKVIAAKLSELSYTDITALEAAEEAGKTRVSLMKVIQEEKDRRTESA